MSRPAHRENERAMAAEQRMIVQVALRNGSESVNIACRQCFLESGSHRDCFKSVANDAESDHVRQ